MTTEPESPGRRDPASGSNGAEPNGGAPNGAPGGPGAGMRPGMRPGMGGPGMGMGPGMGPRAGGRPSLRRAVEVFGNRHYRYLWSSSAFSFFGMNMQMVVRGLLAWELTGSFGATGAIALAFGLPMLLLSLVGGAVADRVNKRNLSLMTQASTGLLALATALLLVTGLMTIEVLFVLGLVQGTFFALGMPARSPLMALVVGPNQILNAMALSNAAMNATRLVGPALAGIVVGLWGFAPAYFIQSTMYVFSVALLLLVPASTGAAAVVDGGRPNMFREIGHGIRYVATDSRLRVLLMMGFILSFFGMPYIMLLPGFVSEDLLRGPDAVGFLQTVSGVGALVGSVMIASATDFPRKPLLQLFAGVFGGAGLILLALASTAWGYPGALGAILVLGFGLTAYQTLNMSMVMEASKPEYYGRVMSIMMLTFSSMSVMAAPLGMVADLIGARALFTIQGGLIIGAMLAISLLNPRYIFGRSEAPEAGVEETAAEPGVPPAAPRVPAMAGATQAAASPDPRPAGGGRASTSAPDVPESIPAGVRHDAHDEARDDARNGRRSVARRAGDAAGAAGAAIFAMLTGGQGRGGA